VFREIADVIEGVPVFFAAAIESEFSIESVSAIVSKAIEGNGISNRACQQTAMRSNRAFRHYECSIVECIDQSL
jgi:hypothetical protein